MVRGRVRVRVGMRVRVRVRARVKVRAREKLSTMNSEQRLLGEGAVVMATRLVLGCLFRHRWVRMR